MGGGGYPYQQDGVPHPSDWGDTPCPDLGPDLDGGYPCQQDGVRPYPDLDRGYPLSPAGVNGLKILTSVILRMRAVKYPLT